jgi:hypothetical protein
VSLDFLNLWRGKQIALVSLFAVSDSLNLPLEIFAVIAVADTVIKCLSIVAFIRAGAVVSVGTRTTMPHRSTNKAAQHSLRLEPRAGQARRNLSFLWAALFSLESFFWL